MNLVIATKNAHKFREIRFLLKALKRFDLYSLLDFPEFTPSEEMGKTFEENAITKAVECAKHLNMWAIADDSGLVVPALDGAPGVFSARFAGNDASDIDNRKKLLSEMQHLKNDGRYAYFECCLALASPEGLKKVVTGRCEGMILEQERGGKGFGYDPLFLKHDYNFTFGELEEAVKNQVSHRAKAFEKLLITLESLCEIQVPFETYSS